MFEFLDPKLWLRFKTRASINLVAGSGPFLFPPSNKQFSLTDKAAHKSVKRGSQDLSPPKLAAAKTKTKAPPTIQVDATTDKESSPRIDTAKDNSHGCQVEERSTGDTSNDKIIAPAAPTDQNALGQLSNLMSIMA